MYCILNCLYLQGQSGKRESRGGERLGLVFIKKILDFDIVSLSFLFHKYYLIIE